MKKTIQIDKRLHEELKQSPGRNFTERISSLIEKYKPKEKRYKVREDGFLDIPEVQEHEFKKVDKSNKKFNPKNFNPDEYKGKPCEHRDNVLVKVIKLEDGRNRYFYECAECDSKWKQTGQKPRDTSDITEKKMKQIWNANVKGQGGPDYPE